MVVQDGTSFTESFSVLRHRTQVRQYHGTLMNAYDPYPLLSWPAHDYFEVESSLDDVQGSESASTSVTILTAEAYSVVELPLLTSTYVRVSPHVSPNRTSDESECRSRALLRMESGVSQVNRSKAVLLYHDEIRGSDRNQFRMTSLLSCVCPRVSIWRAFPKTSNRPGSVFAMHQKRPIPRPYPLTAIGVLRTGSEYNTRLPSQIWKSLPLLVQCLSKRQYVLISFSQQVRVQLEGVYLIEAQVCLIPPQVCASAHREAIVAGRNTPQA
jgi:hypothetical protein